MPNSTRTAPDFSRPIEALVACHERLRSQCAEMCKLADRVRDIGCDAQAREAAAGILRYFDTAARHHHADEEQDLLPRMLTVATTARGSRLPRLVADIMAEHRVMDRSWTALRPILVEIAAGKRADLERPAVDRFAELYAAHIAHEEDTIFPLAEMVLSPQDFAEIGTSMAQRRGGARC